MRNKYKISALSIAMAAIVLVSMAGVASVSAASPKAVNAAPKVGAPITGTPWQLYDPVGIGAGAGGYWEFAQGATSTTGYNIYYENYAAFNVWKPVIIGASNPSAVETANSIIVMARSNTGALVAKQTTDGSTWTNVAVPAVQILAGTGPVGVYTNDGTTSMLQVMYVNTARNLVDASFNLNTAETTVANLGGIVFATPAATVTSDGFSKVVVVKGTGGAIYEQMYTVNAWSGWSRKFHDGLIGAGASLMLDQGVTPDGVTVNVGQAATTTNVYLFVAGTDGHLYALQSTNDGLTWQHKTFLGLDLPGLNWSPLGGVLTSSVSAATSGVAGFAYVDTRYGDGNIWELYATLNNPTIPNGAWYLWLTGP